MSFVPTPEELEAVAERVDALTADIALEYVMKGHVTFESNGFRVHYCGLPGCPDAEGGRPLHGSA